LTRRAVAILIRMWCIILPIVAASTSLFAQTPAATDETAVRSLIQRYIDARDARDERTIAALLTSDADQYTTGGDWRRGRTAVVGGTARSSKQNPGDRDIDIRSVRFITPDVAIADGHYAIAGSDVRRWTTIVLRREAGEWRISAIRNMAPR